MICKGIANFLMDFNTSNFYYVKILKCPIIKPWPLIGKVGFFKSFNFVNFCVSNGPIGFISPLANFKLNVYQCCSTRLQALR